MIRSNLVFYRNNNNKYEGRICLFDSDNFSIKEIEKFSNCYAPYEVATTQNKVNSYARYFE